MTNMEGLLFVLLLAALAAALNIHYRSLKFEKALIKESEDKKQALLELQGLNAKLHRREMAFGTIYEMALGLESSSEALYNGITCSASDVLDVPIVLLERVDGAMYKTVSITAPDGGSALKDEYPVTFRPFSDSYDPEKVYTFTGPLRILYPAHPVFKAYSPKSILAVPVLSPSGELIMILSALDTSKRVFGSDERHILGIYAGYLSSDIQSREMRKRLQEAGRMELLGKLTAGVAHEVRNPLNSIMSLADALALDTEGNSENAELVKYIGEQVRRLSDLMNDLLEYGRSASPPDMSPISLREAINSAFELMRATYKNDGLIYELFIADGDPLVMADAKRLQQILINVLENSRTHSPRGGRVLVEAGASGRGVCSIKIMDEGPGVPKEILPRVFEPFFSTRKGGSGLGLPIVKNFVESHGGLITICNRGRGQGAEVEILLPLAWGPDS